MKTDKKLRRSAESKQLATDFMHRMIPSIIQSLSTVSGLGEADVLTSLGKHDRADLLSGIDIDEQDIIAYHIKQAKVTRKDGVVTKCGVIRLRYVPAWRKMPVIVLILVDVSVCPKTGISVTCSFLEIGARFEIGYLSIGQTPPFMFLFDALLQPSAAHNNYPALEFIAPCQVGLVLCALYDIGTQPDAVDPPPAPVLAAIIRMLSVVHSIEDFE